MSVLIRVGKQKAILRCGQWLSADPDLEQLLNLRTRLWIQRTGGPAALDQDQEGTVAREMAGQFGGRVLLRVRTRARGTTAVFIRYRQLEFEFT
jgi:hypothetical protein